MTDAKPPAQFFDWATELSDAQGHVTLSEQEAHEIGARLRRLHSENETLQAGYAAARMEIESLQARIKTMAEEHADELMVAHLDGRMRAEQPAGAQQPGATYAALPEMPQFPAHPEPMVMDWSAIEIRVIARYGRDMYEAGKRASHGQAPAQAAPAAVGHNEALLEKLYWEFDSQRKKTGEERWAFKGKMRSYASEFRRRSDGKMTFAQSVSDDMMNLADRLGSEFDDVDPRAWKHLLVYAPKAAPAQPAPQQEVQEPVECDCRNPYSHDECTLRAGCKINSKLSRKTPHPTQAQEPVAWYVTGCSRLLDEDEAKAEARHIGGTARAIPLYTAPQADSVLDDAGGANWQDISTAPKDGTRFVAVGQNYGLDSETQHTCIAQRLAGCWVEVSEWNGASKLKYLTHWMPLPPLPGSAASAPADSVTAPVSGEVAYLDIGAGGYIDLGTDLSNEALSRLPKGRHVLVIAGTYGIDGYIPTPPAQAADSLLEDAARLDFLIEQRAYVVSDPDACPGYWLHFVHKETGKCWAQADEHPTPRAAIDAAMKKGANHD